MLSGLIRSNIKRLQNLSNTRLGQVAGGVRKLGGYAPVSPLVVELALTYRCQVRCLYCYQDVRNRHAYPDMTFEDIVLYEDNIRRSFRRLPRLYLFGGEPTLNEDFGRIFRFLSDKGYRLLLTTNGLGLGDYIDDIIASEGLESLVLSLNPFNIDETEAFLGRLDAQADRLCAGVSLNCPLDMVMELGLDPVDLVHRFESHELRFISFQHSQSSLREASDYDVQRYREHVRRLQELKARRPVTLFPDVQTDDLDTYLVDPAFPGPKSKCVLPWLDVFVRPNGDVTPCDEVPVVLGNLKRERLADIWNGSAARAFRRDLERDGVSHPVCVRCCHRRFR